MLVTDLQHLRLISGLRWAQPERTFDPVPWAVLKLGNESRFASGTPPELVRDGLVPSSLVDVGADESIDRAATDALTPASADDDDEAIAAGAVTPDGVPVVRRTSSTELVAVGSTGVDAVVLDDAGPSATRDREAAERTRLRGPRAKARGGPAEGDRAALKRSTRALLWC